MLIELWDCRYAMFILPWPSQVTYSNQTGGVLCVHPTMEGIAFPLETLIDEISLMNFWSEDGLLSYPQMAESFFQDHFVARDFVPVLQDQLPDIAEWGEAWVPVMVKPNPRSEVLKNLVGRVGILTYQNSD